eukprot:15482988-Alexandrium_andersonii.AAC.1
MQPSLAWVGRRQNATSPVQPKRGWPSSLRASPEGLLFHWTPRASARVGAQPRTWLAGRKGSN